MDLFISGEAVGTAAPVATGLEISSSPPRSDSRSSRFHLIHVARSAAMVISGDTCKETCKLECHSGAPFTDWDEDVPQAVC